MGARDSDLVKDPVCGMVKPKSEMKKLLVIITLVIGALIILPGTSSAMMHWSESVNSDQELTDEDYEKLGEEWMKTMMGDQHEEADEQMRQMMGDAFLQQMHIAMGKQSQNPGKFGMMPVLALSPSTPLGINSAEGMGMMGGMGMMDGLQTNPARTTFVGIHYALAVVTWLLLIAFLIALTRYFWKKTR